MRKLNISLMKFTSLFFIFYLEACINNSSKDFKKDSLISNNITKDSSNLVSSDSLKSSEYLRDIHICTEMLPPPKGNKKLSFKSDTSIYYRDEKVNDTIIKNELKKSKQGFQKQQFHQFIAEWYPFHWDHTELTVTFLDGDSLVQNRVKNTAKIWEQYCGIKLNFGKFSDANITISFKYIGPWSYIGNYSTQNRPSMNFGWLTSTTSQDEYNRVVLHEFGHALGFIHEHQNPKGNIPWNKDKVYKYYMGPPNNWDKNNVDENIFKKYDLSELNATDFDPKSIMLYAIPSDLTDGHFSTNPNSSLSDMDKQLVSKIYPKK